MSRKIADGCGPPAAQRSTAWQALVVALEGRAITQLQAASSDDADAMSKSHQGNLLPPP